MDCQRGGRHDGPEHDDHGGPHEPDDVDERGVRVQLDRVGSTFQCKLDTAAYAACTSAKVYSGSTMGSHTFSVRAIDAAGNMDASAATKTWMINSRPRLITSRSPRMSTARQRRSPAGPTTFDASSATCADAPCTYTWTDDGSDGAGGTNWAVGTGKLLAFTFQGKGLKNIRLTVKDADGDTASTVKAITVN